MAEIVVGIITVSDKASKHERVDKSGPALIELCQNNGWLVSKTCVINDDLDLIRSTLIELCKVDSINLVLTTGGTGMSPRDNTPEATLSVIEKTVPGISEFIRRVSYDKNPNSIISRGVTGIRNGKLIINLPGSPSAAVECLQSIQNVIPHAVDLLLGITPH